MQPQAPVPSPETTPSLRTFALILSSAVAAIAGLALLGWVLDIHALKEVVPGTASMKVNAALSFLALAVAVVLPRRHPVGWVLIAFVLVVALLTGVETMLGRDLGLDELLVDDPDSGGDNAPGRMAPQTTVAMLLLVVAQSASRLGLRRATEVAAGAAGMIGLISLLVFLFGAETEINEAMAHSSVALHTAVCLVLLAVATAALVPHGFVPWLLTDRGLGATALRPIVPLALLVIPLVGVVVAWGDIAGWYGEHVGEALLSAAAGVLMLGAAYGVSRRLERVDQQRRRAQEELGLLNASLEEGRDAAWREVHAMRTQLEEERRRFDRAISKIDDLLWTAQVTPQGTLEVVFTTPSARGVFGGGILAGESFLDLMEQLVHPEDRALLVELLAQFGAGRRGEAEFRLIGRDGRMRWLWCRGGPRRENDRLYVDGIITNVSDQHRLTEERERILALEREQVAKLTALNELREELFANAGHEIRTPLAAIRGFSELLLQREDLDTSARDQIGIIHGRSVQLTGLVGDFFDLARFTAGTVDLDVDYVRVDALARDAARAQAPAAEEADLSLQVDVRPVMVSADPVRIRQVLDNLVSNAVKYSRPGGTVLIEVRREGTQVVVRVSDEGIGIPPEELPHVFDRMFRGSNAKAQGIPGTGLGLALSRMIAEVHGGTLTCGARDTGAGMVFELVLPVDPDHHPDHDHENDTAGDGSTPIRAR